MKVKPALLWSLLAVLMVGAAAAFVVFRPGTNQSGPGIVEASSNNPSGSVRVAGSDNLPKHPIAGDFKPDNRKLADCKSGDQVCYEQAYGNLTYYEGPKVALAEFDKAIAQRGPIESGCHRISHTIGSAALARYKGKVGQAFAEGSSSCWSGYYHGILERAFLQVKSYEASELARVSRDLCSDPDIRRTSWIAYQCVHGLGHGLMISSELDLELALAVCNKLDTEWDRQSCKGGAFMENISTSYGVKSKWLKDDDLVYPCNVVKEGDKLYCYLMVTSRILNANGYDWNATAKLCANGEKNWVATCFQSYGRDASGSSRQSTPDILRLCNDAGKEGGTRDCLIGAAKDVTANYSDGAPAAKLCDAASDNLRGVCYHSVGTITGGFKASAEERLEDCKKLSTDATLVEQCRRGSVGEGVLE